MKKILFYLLTLVIGLASFSCQKNDSGTNDSREIILVVNDVFLNARVDTKAVAAVESVPSSLYWGATTGGGSETVKWSSASGTVSDGKISTDKYQTLTPTTYNYYISNVNLSVGANTTVSATGGTAGTDVVCGRASSSSSTPSVVMNHIFARTGSITTTCANGSLSNVSYTIKAKGANTGTGGTYNLTTGAWSSVSGIESETALTASSDMYVIPGSYTVAATATYTRGDYVVTKTLSADIDLTVGKVNNLSFTWPDAGEEIIVSASLTAWSSQGVAATLVAPPTFGGLQIAPGPLYYNGSTYAIYNDWNHASFDSNNPVYGKNTGSTYFSYQQMGELFEKSGFSSSDGDIDNLLNPLAGWRLPTRAEWCTLTTGASPGTSRDGSTVNGTSGAKFAIIGLTGVWHAGTQIPLGILLFPDGETISGKELDGINDWETCTIGVTGAELTAYLVQGCAFLSTGGFYSTEHEHYIIPEESGFYLSSSMVDGSGDHNIYGVQFGYQVFTISSSFGFDEKYYAVRLVK